MLFEELFGFRLSLPGGPVHHRDVESGGQEVLALDQVDKLVGKVVHVLHTHRVERSIAPVWCGVVFGRGFLMQDEK